MMCGGLLSLKHFFVRYKKGVNTMQINLSELLTVPGKSMTYTQPVEMEQFHGPAADYPVTEKQPAELTITHTEKKKLRLEGKAHLTLLMPCDRCLEPVPVPFSLPLSEELDLETGDEEGAEEQEEHPYIQEYLLDVDQLITNELMVNLPMKVLCREDCKGICPRCGQNLNHGDCGCDRVAPDPRMVAIQDIFQRFHTDNG